MGTFRSLSQWAVRAAVWSVQVWTHLTADGWFFITLILLCSLGSIGSQPWANIPLLVSLVLLSLWLLSLWNGSRSLERIGFRRSCTERAFANEPVTVSVYLSNASRLPSAGVIVSERIEAGTAVRGETRPGAADAPGKAARPPLVVAQGMGLVSAIAGQGVERARYTLVLRRRGIYRFGPATLETSFPLGFFQSTRVRNVPGRLIIYPRFGEVDSSFLEDMDIALRHVRIARPTRAEENCRGLRDYRQGDSAKWIHWRSSARLGRLLVREFEEPQAKRVLLLLDTNLQRLGAQRFAANEQAISFAGTLARDLILRNYEIEFLALQPGGRTVRLAVSRERRNLSLLLESLAGLRRDDTRTLAAMAEHLPRHRLHHVFVLVLGLGSLRGRLSWRWLETLDNAVKILDVRGEEFRHLFRAARTVSARDQFTEEDLLLGIGDEDAPEEEEEAAETLYPRVQ